MWSLQLCSLCEVASSFIQAQAPSLRLKREQVIMSTTYPAPFDEASACALFLNH